MTGRLMSSSQPVSLRGPRTIRGGSLQLTPSLLSTRARLCFGRHESHMRQVSASLSTETSKQVPYLPPMMGLPGCLTQPAVVSAAGESAAGKPASAMAQAAARKEKPSVMV